MFPWRIDVYECISIHALHEESDRNASHRSGCGRNFNPRSP